MQSTKLSFFVAFLVTAALLAGCAATSDRESTGQVIDDSVITTKVRAKLVDDFA